MFFMHFELTARDLISLSTKCLISCRVKVCFPQFFLTVTGQKEDENSLRNNYGAIVITLMNEAKDVYMTLGAIQYGQCM